jgi:hypothetical protein
LLVRYIGAAAHRLLVVNLGDDYPCPMNDALFAPLPRTEWQQLWSSEQPQYGGRGGAKMTDENPWLITARTAVLLGSVAI